MIYLDQISPEVYFSVTFPNSEKRGCGDCSETPDSNPVDRVSISDDAKEARASARNPNEVITQETQLTQEEKAEVNRLKRMDAEVKAHERAHMAAGGEVVAGPASYQYTRGPDGKQYAVSGEVEIDVSKERDPEATIRKMQQVRKAALAPAQPSPTDRRVAAQASQIEAQARAELSKQKSESSRDSSEQTTEILAPPIDRESPKGSQIDLVV